MGEWRGYLEIDGIPYVVDSEENRVYSYIRKGAKPVVVQPGWIHRVMRAIGLGVWAKKPYIKWVGGEYSHAPDLDITLDDEVT